MDTRGGTVVLRVRLEFRPTGGLRFRAFHFQPHFNGHPTSLWHNYSRTYLAMLVKLPATEIERSQA